MNSGVREQVQVELKIIQVHSVWLVNVCHQQRLVALSLGIWRAGEYSGHQVATVLLGKEPGIFRHECIFMESRQVIELKIISTGRESVSGGTR